MRRSPAQREASRNNGAKSNGPVTPEGKRQSSRNSLRHGMLTHTVVLDGEDPERFAELIAEFEDHLDPQNPIERAIVENLAIARWRTQRLWALEKVTIEDQIDAFGENSADPVTRVAQAYRSLANDSGRADLLHRYETRCDRQFYRALTQLLRYRQENQILPSEPTSV